MPTLRLALAQIDVTVGDLAGNAATVLERTREAAAAGANLVAFPEMALTGYPPEDLVLRSSFRDASRAALHELAAQLGRANLAQVAVVVGYLDDDTAEGGGARDASALLLGGQVVATCYKHHLPNYGVFDERRYFVPGDSFTLVRALGVDIGLTVCEDLWQDGGPFAVARAGRRRAGRQHQRLAVRAQQGRRAACSCCAGVRPRRMPRSSTSTWSAARTNWSSTATRWSSAPDGQVLLRAPQYVEGVFYLDLDLPAATSTADPLAARGFGMSSSGWTPARRHRCWPAPRRVAVRAARITDEAEVWGALVAGLRDYVRKNGFSSVVLGMSGGIDSAVVAAIAADAIGGAERVRRVHAERATHPSTRAPTPPTWPSGSARKYQVVPIAPMVEAFVSALSS